MLSPCLMLICFVLIHGNQGFLTRKGLVLPRSFAREQDCHPVLVLSDAVNRPVGEEFRNPNDTSRLNERLSEHSHYYNEPYPAYATGQANIVAPTRSMLDRWIDKYNRHLLLHPMRTKMLSSAVIAALGDFLLQIGVYVSQNYHTLSLGDFQFDSLRTLTFFLVSGLYGAPVTHYWFNYLNSLPFLQRRSKRDKALAMTLIDQTVGAVAVTSGFFFLYEIVSMLCVQ
ncbi:hypothetical protein EON64_11740 [archaeon]|nr:MAG: hypothetical protein EON64_11740 [archaeon]